MDVAVFPETVYELAIHLLWSVLWGRFHPVDVYHQAFPIQHGLSDGQSQLCDGHVRGHHLLSRTDTYDQMAGCIPDHVWLYINSKMK